MAKRRTQSVTESQANAAISIEPRRATVRSGMRAIVVRGARTHNLKSVDIDLPHHQFTVITGVSGSGKSSLAFDTVFAEGLRQYIESLSIYARQFLNQLQRPDVDSIEGLQPTLCIDQRAGLANPRSTVATVTEVYDYLRLMMARVGTPTCYQCGLSILQQSPEQILSTLQRLPEGTKLVLMAPMVRGRRGAHREELSAVRKAGLVKIRIDGVQYDVDDAPELQIRKNHSIEAIVDKLVIRDGVLERLAESVQVALRLADGLVLASYIAPESVASRVAEKPSEPSWTEEIFSTRYACPNCGINYAEVEPRTFSFNSPYGACPKCDGVGEHQQYDPALMISDWSQSPDDGAFTFLQAADKAIQRKLRKRIEPLVESLGGEWNTPLDKLKPAARRKLMEGDNGTLGLVQELQAFEDSLDEEDRRWLEPFKQHLTCVECNGSRLRKEALAIRLGGKSIFEICSLSIGDLGPWLEQLPSQLNADQQNIARPILVEMTHRIRFLNKVGLSYLTLARSADTLSGGELQRVRLATSIGSGLVGVSYILDEPSIGLHQRDNDRLIDSLRDLQKQGNTVIVVEHDEAMMRASQFLVDMGPGAGKQGGHIVASGAPDEVIQHPTSVTAQYLRGEVKIHRLGTTRTPTAQPQLTLTGATLHNLQNVSVSIPLGCLVGVTGVSGSGKSSLIVETLVPALARQLHQSAGRVGPFKSLTGFEHVDKLIEITQDPIGRTPRSTPATYWAYLI